MAKITGYGQSARIEWDRPVEFYFVRSGESVKAYMDRMLVDASKEEVEATVRLVDQCSYQTFQAPSDAIRKPIHVREVVRYFADRRKVFDVAAFLAG